MERLGKKIYAIPFVICIFATCVLSCMFYPMIHMDLKGLPIAIVSEDAGAQTPVGMVNAGDQIVDTMMAMNETGELPFIWTEVEDADSLDAAFDEGSYYAALVIPENFTQSSAAGQPATLTLMIDHARSPMVASLMGPMLKTQLEMTGALVSVQAVHGADFEENFVGNNPVAPAIGQQIIIATIMVLSMITGILITLIMHINRKDETAAKVKTVAQQAAYALVVSLVIATCISCIVMWVVNVGMPVLPVFVISWIAAWCMIVCFNGLANIHPALAVLTLLVMVAAMMCGILPVEALPEVWQNLVIPWAPQVFIGDALRATLYAGSGYFTSSLVTMFAFPAVGLVLSVLSCFIPIKEK